MDELYCKSCFEKIKISTLRSYLEKKPILCDKCTMETSDLHMGKVADLSVTYLNVYDGLMKEWLLKYKEQRDVELAPCFLFRYSAYLKFLSKTHVIVPLPSSAKKLEERGFSHLGMMLECYGIPHVDALIKESNLVQKEASASERVKSSSIRLKDGMSENMRNKRILLFDDVVTTGSTLKEAYGVLKQNGAGKIRAFVLMDNSSVEHLRLR